MLKEMLKTWKILVFKSRWNRASILILVSCVVYPDCKPPELINLRKEA